MGFLLNLSFPAEVRHVLALQDVVAQAIRQAGGDDDRARDFAEQAAALLRDASVQPGTDRMAVVVELGPPIQVIVGDQTLTFDNPAEAGHHDPS